MKHSFAILGCSLSLLLLLAGCLGGQPVAWQDPAVDMVWPEPPEPARIIFLRSLGKPSDLKDKGQASRMLGWLVGRGQEEVPLLAPYGVAADGEGKIWIADTGASLVQFFDLEHGRTAYITTAGNEKLATPVGVAVDTVGGVLYVSDTTLNKVLALSYEGDLQAARVPPGGFGRPGGMTVDSRGNLYVVDVLRGKIEVFDKSGDHRRSIGSAVAPAGKFNRPSNIAVDPEGRIFVSDAMNFRIEALDAYGNSLGIIGGLGDVPGTFARPRGVAIDSEGHVYVADAAFDNIQVFDLTGNLLLYFGGNGREPGEFNLPAGLFFDREDRLYVVDSYNRRLQIFKYLGKTER